MKHHLPVALFLTTLAGSTQSLAGGPFPPAFDLSTLDGTSGFVLNGIRFGDFSGESVSCAGDVNGDGVSDIIIGAILADPEERTDSGESYVVFGGAGIGSTGVIELSSLNGTNGFVLRGVNPFDRSGASVASAGDMNGDGFDDIIIGAYAASSDGLIDTGESYVVFGSATIGSTGVIELDDLDGSNGFSMPGVDEYDISGRSVSGAGDVNGDGFSDILIEAYRASSSGYFYNGEVYLVFGGESVGSTGTVELSSLDGTNGFTLIGSADDSQIGYSVSSAGDFNGDGIHDIVISSWDTYTYGQYSAECYVIYGSVGIGNSGLFNLGTLDGTNGFAIEAPSGIDGNDIGPFKVSAAGDINNDGVDDILLGAFDADPDALENAGESYVIFGGTGVGASGLLELSTLTSANGFVMRGTDAEDVAGASVSSAGDINGDGIGDVLIGAAGADPNGITNAGESYIVYGNSSIGATGTLALSGLDGTNGFVLDGIDADDRSGVSVSSTGDINGDGIDDIVIGAFTADPNGIGTAGESYVVFGRASTSPVDFNSDGAVNSADLAILLAAWSTPNADLNNDGTTNAADLAILLAAWTG